MSDIFKVNLERFSGPYYKILELIEEKKLSINEFSLSQITDEYISFIKNLNQNTSENIIDISEFIVVASILILIKTKSLFPNIVSSEEENNSISSFQKKLEIYKIMLYSSKIITNQFNQEILYNLPKQKNLEKVFVWDSQINKIFLHSIAIATILKFPKTEKLKEIAIKQIIKIEDIIEKLLNKINFTKNISFQEFSNITGQNSSNLKEKRNLLIVVFLAMLELIKTGLIQAKQDENSHNKIELSKI